MELNAKLGLGNEEEETPKTGRQSGLLSSYGIRKYVPIVVEKRLR